MVEAPAPLLKLSTDFYREFYNKPLLKLTTDFYREFYNKPLLKLTTDFYREFYNKPLLKLSTDFYREFYNKPLLKLSTDFYREFFNKPGMETVDRWGDHGPTPLTIEISVAEVAYAASKLKNGKAPGPDGIPCELLKYAGMEVKIKIGETLNKMFATQDPLLLLGNGLLIVLNKPG